MIREDTELRNFPLYCPKCKQESLIDTKDLQVTVIKGIEVKMQSWLAKRQIGIYEFGKFLFYNSQYLVWICEDALESILYNTYISKKGGSHMEWIQKMNAAVN